jgi:hypothetical protein
MHSILIVADRWSEAMRRLALAADEVACALRRLDSVADDIKSAAVQLAYEPTPQSPRVMAVRHLKAQRRASSNRPARLPSSYG